MLPLEEPLSSRLILCRVLALDSLASEDDAALTGRVAAIFALSKDSVSSIVAVLGRCAADRRMMVKKRKKGARAPAE